MGSFDDITISPISNLVLVSFDRVLVSVFTHEERLSNPLLGSTLVDLKHNRQLLENLLKERNGAFQTLTRKMELYRLIQVSTPANRQADTSNAVRSPLMRLR